MDGETQNRFADSKKKKKHEDILALNLDIVLLGPRAVIYTHYETDGSF